MLCCIVTCAPGTGWPAGRRPGGLPDRQAELSTNYKL